MPHVQIGWIPGRILEHKREPADVSTRNVCRIGMFAPEPVGIVSTDIDTQNRGSVGALFSDRCRAVR